MEQRMRFSIIVPVYNVETYLRECVESVLSQDFQDYELLLIDDGSPDACPTICDEYAEKDARVKVVHKANGGLVSARKTGAELAQGEYVLNLDGDDWFADGFLRTINDAILKSDGADVIGFGYTEKKGSEEKIVRHKLSEGVYAGEKLEEVREIYLYDKYQKGTVCDAVIIAITKAVKREFYLACQALVRNEITKGEDAMMGWFLLLSCRSFYVMQYAGYMYRTVATSMSRKLDEKDFAILKLLVEQMRSVVPKQYLNQVQCYTFYRLMDLFTLVARTYDYKTYRKLLKENLDQELLKFALQGKIYKKRKEEWAKLLLLKGRMWRVLYKILRNYGECV